MIILSLEQLFEGNQNTRGILARFDGVKKIAFSEPKPFDWVKHINGEQPQGLSPVNTETAECRWLCLDVDLKIKPEEFCKNIFEKIGHQYFCFMTMGGKWRVVEFLDDWMGVDEAKDRAKKLEQKVEKLCGYKCDSGHTLPQSYDIENGMPGGWIFIPYHDKKTVCYSPGGLPINKQQCEFRAHYRNYPMIVSAVGMRGEGEGGSRRKALWMVMLNMKHDETLDVSLEELNKHFEIPLSDLQLSTDIKHVTKTTANEKYDKKYFLNGMPGWVQSICGAKPYLDAKSFSAVSTELVDQYLYVRIRDDMFELDTMTFVDMTAFDHMWAHYSKKFKKPMSKLLLEDERMKKVIRYFTHAGKPEGIVEIAEGEVKGLDGGTYLNIYKPSDIVASKGDITRIDEYFNFAFGEENWLIVKQCIAFMLNEPGEKIQWFLIIQGPTQGVGKKLLAQVMQRMLGPRNVRPNVAFKDLTGPHSTIIDGAQLIILNEVALSKNTGVRKELSEEFKNLITDDNLMVNAKFKQPVEIPNLANFWVLSNSITPVYMDSEDRRACVIQIRRTKEEVQEMLVNQGYKKDLKDLYDDPSAFKYHLMNEVKYDRNMFFENAPMNADKQEMIEANKGEFTKVMDMKYEASKFPFGNLIRHDAVEMYSFKGMLNLDTTFEAMLTNPTFRQTNKMYWGLDELKDHIKSIAISWKEGKPVGTRQIKSVYGYMRVWLIHDYEVKGRKLSTMTEGELGAIWDQKLSPEDINTAVTSMPNYEEPFSEDKEYDTNCWSCKKAITQTHENTCNECNYAIKCECGQCACDKPGNEFMKKKGDIF